MGLDIMKPFRYLVTYIVIVLLIVFFGYLNVQRFNLYEILPFKCVLLIEQLIIPLFPFIFGALLGRNWKYLSLSRWHIILNIVLLIVLLPLGFTELTVAIWGAPSFLGSLAKISGTSGTRILFLVFTGMLFGRLTLFIHGLPLTKTQ